MRTLLRSVTLLVAGTATLWADDSLLHARQAQALLGPDVWSQIIRIENTAPHSSYPRTLHALVFELEGVLWFYTDRDGTQSFSLHRGRLAEEKSDYGPLLRDIEPGFTHWQPVTKAAKPAHPPRRPLPNGCFIQSVAAARALGGEANHPQLLTYYVPTTSGLHGHTVLTYRTRDHVAVLDPEWPSRADNFPAALGHDALALARELRGTDVVGARLLPLDEPVLTARRYTATATAGAAPRTSQS